MSITITFISCGTENVKNSVNEADSTESSIEVLESSDITQEDASIEMTAEEFSALKVAVISGASGIEDNTFNEDIYNGIIEYVSRHPASSVTPIKSEYVDNDEILLALNEIEDEYDVIVCGGVVFNKITQYAQQNPNQKFVLIDAFPIDKNGNDVELENVYGMQFAEQESGFLAGMAAALETKTGKVAVVNGIAYPSNINYQYGFECGVKYINETEGSDVEIVELPTYSGTNSEGLHVGGNYINSFTDTETAKKIGKLLINEGCDIIFVAAGGAGMGVFDAVKEAEDVYVIGCDIDQFEQGIDGDENIVLTCALKNMHQNVEQQLEEVTNGTFQGGNVVLHADTDSVGYVKDSERCQLSDTTIEKMDTAYELLKTGAIVPASYNNGVRPENFTTQTTEEMR